MRALRFVALAEDGEHLVLAPDVPEAIDSGERFVLKIDDRLRAASRGDISRLGQIEIEIESNLRPKEIQARIRAGETPESVAAAAGVRLERVMRYAYPVLQERQQIAERSQNARVKLEDTTQSPTLMELIAQRLLVGGADPDSIVWDARRLEDGMWEVSSTWKTKSKTITATWRFDLSTRTVFPGNSQTSELVEPAPKLSAVPTHTEDPSLDDAVTGPIPIVQDEAPARRQRPRSRRDSEREVSLGDLFTTEELDDASDPGHSADLGRRRTANGPVSEPALSAVTSVEQVVPEDDDSDHAEHGKDKKPRIPSWDDIVFGVKRRK